MKALICHTLNDSAAVLQVEVTVTSPTDIDTFDLGLRMPNWVSSPSVPITVNGSAAQPGQPGSYVHVVMTPWPKGATTIRFDSSMAETRAS